MSFLKHLFPLWKTNLDDKSKANAAILAAIDTELTDSELEAIQSQVLMSLETATDIWLDEYGTIFGVLRKDNELDGDYRGRITNYILLNRGTVPAIIAAVRNFLQDNVSYINVYEPFNNIFFLNQSKLNSEDSLLGSKYTTAVIDILFTDVFPTSILDVVNQFKPAGVSVYLTRKPKAYNPAATPFTVNARQDPITMALDIQNRRDNTYVSIGNSDIIGYKRVYKTILTRPLASTEDVNNPPYPVIYYGNIPWVLVPAENAVAEGAHWVYMSVRLEPEDFPNQGYSVSNLYFNVAPIGDTKETLVPTEVSRTGLQLAADVREAQGRTGNIIVEEEFILNFVPVITDGGTFGADSYSRILDGGDFTTTSYDIVIDGGTF